MVAKWKSRHVHKSGSDFLAKFSNDGMKGTNILKKITMSIKTLDLLFVDFKSIEKCTKKLPNIFFPAGYYNLFSK